MKSKIFAATAALPVITGIVIFTTSAVVTYDRVVTSLNLEKSISIINSESTRINRQIDKCRKELQSLEVLLNSYSALPDYESQYNAIRMIISCIENIPDRSEDDARLATDFQTILYNYQNLLDNPEAFTIQARRDLKEDVEQFIWLVELGLWTYESLTNYLIAVLAVSLIDFSINILKGSPIILLSMIPFEVIKTKKLG